LTGKRSESGLFLRLAKTVRRESHGQARVEGGKSASSLTRVQDIEIFKFLNCGD
jgi:hypothetical protein